MVCSSRGIIEVQIAKNNNDACVFSIPNNNNNKSSYQHTNIIYNVHKSIYSKILSDFYFTLDFYFGKSMDSVWNMALNVRHIYNHRYRVYGSIYWKWHIVFIDFFSLSPSRSLPTKKKMMKRAFHSLFNVLNLNSTCRRYRTFQPKIETYGLKLQT